MYSLLLSKLAIVKLLQATFDSFNKLHQTYFCGRVDEAILRPCFAPPHLLRPGATAPLYPHFVTPRCSHGNEKLGILPENFP